jgi:hypothetical protein
MNVKNFKVYNWDKSGYLNAKETIVKNAISSAGKANKIRQALDNGVEDVRQDGKAAISISDNYMAIPADTLFSTVGDEYIQYPLKYDAERNTKETLKGIPVGVDIDALFNTSRNMNQLYPTTHSGTNRTIGRIEILNFINNYKAERPELFKEANISADKNNHDVSWLSLDECMDMVEYLRDAIDTEEGEVYVANYYSEYYTGDDPSGYANEYTIHSSYPGYGPRWVYYDYVNYPTLPAYILTDNHRYLFRGSLGSFDKAFDASTIASQNKVILKVEDTPTTLGDGEVLYAGTIYETTQVYEFEEESIEPGIVSRNTSNVPRVQELVDWLDEDVSEEQKFQSAFYKVCMNMLNYLVTRGYLVSESTKMDMNTFRYYIDEVLIPELTYRKHLADNLVETALSTEVGKLLKQLTDVEGILEVNTDRAVGMELAFRVNCVKGVNYYRDEDMASDYEVFKKLAEEILGEGEWKGYFYAVVRKVTDYQWDDGITTVTTSYQVMAYIPNWDAMEKLPPDKLMALLYSMFPVIDAQYPKPKRGLFKQLVMVIVAAVITYASWGTLGPEAAALVVASLTLQTVAILTGNKQIAKLATIVGIAAMGYGAITTIGNDIMNISLNQALLYAINATSYLMKRQFQIEFAKIQGQIGQNTEAINEMEELLDIYSKQQKVEKFVYTDRYTDLYEGMYEYDYTYSYIS